MENSEEFKKNEPMAQTNGDSEKNQTPSAEKRIKAGTKNSNGQVAGEIHTEEKPMKKLEWTSDLSVDIQEIDDLQQKMFALLNVLIDIKGDNANAKDRSVNVAELTEYGRYYFGKEEELLKKAGYPEVEEHAKEHRRFIKTTVSLRRQVAEDKENLTYAVIRELRDWLIVHISTFDARYVPFLRTVNYLDACRKR